MPKNTRKPGFQQIVQKSLSERLQAMSRQFEDMAEGHRAITSSDDMTALCSTVRTMVADARKLEAPAPASDGPVVNDAATSAVMVIYEAEDALAQARRALIERHRQKDADPAGKVGQRLAQTIAKLQQAQAIVAGGRAVQS